MHVIASTSRPPFAVLPFDVTLTEARRDVHCFCPAPSSWCCRGPPVNLGCLCYKVSSGTVLRALTKISEYVNIKLNCRYSRLFFTIVGVDESIP